jgi:uncharacterized membrane protein
MKKTQVLTPLKQVTLLFLLASLIGAAFFAIGVLRNNSMDHWYLLWNLVLAWIPFGLSIWLRKLLKTYRWSSWLPLGVTALWLGFLPNTFYMLTDYIHLQDVERVDIVYDVAMFTVLIATGVCLGFVSLAIVHSELRKRLSKAGAWRVVSSIIFLASFAIYVGRDLRWNTWDIITSPAGILFDISERVINPTAHSQTFVITATYYVLLSLGYYCLWRLVGLVRAMR